MTTVTDLRRRLELERLAAELGTDPDALDALGAVDPDELAHLRHALGTGLVAHHAPFFDGFAHASTLVPAALAARVTRSVIGPALAGRMAGSMSGQRAAAIMGHLDTPFLADCCQTLSSTAAAALVPAIEDEQVVATSRELARRDDHATLGRFVDALDDRRLRLVLDAISDPRHLLLSGAATDSGEALDRVIGLLTPDQRGGVVVAAPAHPAAAANVLVRVAPESRGLLVQAVARQDDAELVDLLDRLADAVTASPTLRLAAETLPGAELAAASALLDRSEELRRAIGRLVMAIVRADDEPTSMHHGGNEEQQP